MKRQIKGSIESGESTAEPRLRGQLIGQIGDADDVKMAGAAGLERDNIPAFSSEKIAQTKASQRDTLIDVNQGFQDEKEN